MDRGNEGTDVMAARGRGGRAGKCFSRSKTKKRLPTVRFHLLRFFASVFDLGAWVATDR